MAIEKSINLKLKTTADNKGAKDTTKELKSIKLEAQDVQRSLNAVSNSFRNITTRFLSMAKTVDKLTSYTDKMITAQNVLNQTFGKTTDIVNNYIDKLAYMTGISTTDIKNKTSLFGQMAVSLGMSTEKANEFSIALDDLSAKLSLLYNIDFNSSAKALLDAVKGESSTLTTLTGIVIKTQSLQNTLNELGVNMLASNLTGANLALVQYITVAKEVNATNKDMQKIVNDVAWQKQVLKNQVKELANAIGNVLYPVLRAILPVLNGILIAITTIINTLASLFGITKRSSNNISDTAEAFNNLGGSIAGATEKAKKSLRPFDKLNNITTPTPTTGSGGGGGGINPALYSEAQRMADEMLKIKNRAQEIADEILKWLGFTKDVNGQLKWSGVTLLKNIYNWWYKLSLLGKIMVGLGLAVGIAKVYTNLKKIIALVKATRFADIVGTIVSNIKEVGLAGFVKNLTTAYPILTKIVGISVGILDLIQGIKNVKEGLASIKNEGTSLNNVIQTTIGLIEILSGMALIVGVLTGNVPLIIAGGIGTITSVIGELGLNLSNSKNNVEQLASSMDFGSDKIKTYNKNIEELKSRVGEATEVIYAKTNRAKELSQEITSMYDENNKFIGSEEELSSKVNTLNNLLGTNVQVLEDGNLKIGDRIVNGNELNDVIDEYCKKLRVQAELEAYYDLYVERAKKKIELEKLIKEKTDELTKAQENYDMTTEDGVKKFLVANGEKITDLNKLQSALDENDQAMKNYEEASYRATLGQYDTVMSYLIATTDGVEREYDKTVEDIINQSNRIPQAIKENITKVNNLTAVVKVTMDSSEFQKQWKKAQQLTTGTGMQMGGVIFRAGGGFVDTGQIFVARENGINEMVGHIGRKTAVANNDQIVEAVASGVARANMMTKSNQKVEIIAEGDTSGLLDFITFKQKERERQYGF